MNKRAFELLLDELKLQTNFALTSINHFNEVYNKMSIYDVKKSEEESLVEKNEFWFYLQSLASAVANISKIFYSSKGNRESRKQYEARKKEREIFTQFVGEDIFKKLKKRKMRNALEHIDERIESFSKRNPNIQLNMNILPSNGISIDGKLIFQEDHIDNLRNFITDKNEFVLFGEKMNMNEITERL